MPAGDAAEPRSTPFTLGKIEEGLAILVSDDLQLVEFPYDCLPSGPTGPVQVGSLITLQIAHDDARERARLQELLDLQEEILELFGKGPDDQVVGSCLDAGRVTHDTVVVKWSAWKQLATEHGWRAHLHSLDCYVNDSIIQSNIDEEEGMLRLTGLDPGADLKINLVFRTTAGTFATNTLALFTPPETELTGHLYLQIFADADGSITSLAAEIGAHVLPMNAFDDADDSRLPTHLVAQKSSDVPLEALLKASSLGIPVVTPDWLQACITAKRLLPASDFLFKQ